MIKHMLIALRWSLSLGAKFVRVVPGATFVIVLLTIVSQLSTLLASFLPLKVVILLGSEGMPRYFPSSFSEVDRDVLIASLSAATVGFFILSLVAEKLITTITSSATRCLLARSHKMVLFESQDEVAAKAYQRYSRALAGGIFIALAMLGMGLVYPAMATLLVAYILIALLVLRALHGRSAVFRERLEKRLAPTLSLVGGVGFFASFAYLVADFILWTSPGVIIAIISLLLSRQIFNRATGMVVDLTALQKQRAKLNALFFHGKVLLPEKTRIDRSMWPLLYHEKRHEWLQPVLSEVAGVFTTDSYLKVRWRYSGVANVAVLQVGTPELDSTNWLVKLFDVNRSSLALHEATLLTDAPEGLPALSLTGATQVQRFHCLVYSLPVGRLQAAKSVKQIPLQMRADLLAVEPPTSLVRRYQRSRPMLWQRLTESMLERLFVAADSSHDVALVEQLIAKLAVLQLRLKKLPLMIVNPDVDRDSIWQSKKENSFYLLNWGRWSLEPLGASWPHQKKLLPSLSEAIEKAAGKRSVLLDVRSGDAEIAALSFALEHQCNRQRYSDGIALLPELLKRIDSAEKDETYLFGDLVE